MESRRSRLRRRVIVLEAISVFRDRFELARMVDGAAPVLVVTIWNV
jgi:hypothetical protein